MSVDQTRPKRKNTGGRFKTYLSKKLANRGSLPTLTKLSEEDKIIMRTRSGKPKTKLYANNVANLFDKKTKKYQKTKIKNIVESPSNRHYVRRNIMTKGTIIETEKGKAKVTSRPGQDGIVNAVLVD